MDHFRHNIYFELEFLLNIYFPLICKSLSKMLAPTFYNSGLSLKLQKLESTEDGVTRRKSQNLDILARNSSQLRYRRKIDAQQPILANVGKMMQNDRLLKLEIDVASSFFGAERPNFTQRRPL